MGSVGLLGLVVVLTCSQVTGFFAENGQQRLDESQADESR